MSATQLTEQYDPSDVMLVGRRSPWGHLLAVLGVLAAVALIAGLFYKQTCANVGLTTRESMDIAQVARNLSDGEGFTTHFIRPFNAGIAGGETGQSPELNHGPLFPSVVAILFKLRGSGGQLAIWASMLFLLGTCAATYLLGRVLFDARTALLAAAVFGVSAPALRAGASGCEWPAAALWFVLLLLVVACHHRRVTPDEVSRWTWTWPLLAGVLVSLLHMTHQVLVFAALPVAAYFAVTGPARRVHLMLFVAAAAAATAPWIWRNWVLTGSPLLGVNAWDVMAQTSIFPGETFYRSADPANRELMKAVLFPVQHFPAFAQKLGCGVVDRAAAVPAMLGIAVMPFAVVHVLYKFRNHQANAVRGMMYLAVPLMLVAFSVFSVHADALLVFAPAAFVFASGYFLLLLGARKLHQAYRRAVIGGFVAAAALPSLVGTAWPQAVAAAKTGPADQYFAGLGNRGVSQVIYTDVPWIAAWRTRCKGVWLPRTDRDVGELASRGLPLRIVILTPESGNYSQEEVWYVLHRVELWREYVRDPQAGVKRILAAAGAAGADPGYATRALNRVKRSFAVSESIAGLETRAPSRDPLVPDDIQIMLPAD